jgi:LysM repeat protein
MAEGPVADAPPDPGLSCGHADEPAAMTDQRLDPDGAADTGPSPLVACPQLVSVDGPWHAAAPSRAHRCRLLAEGRPTLERQRDHCLAAAHVDCPTWLEAYGAAGAPARPGPFVATAPVVMEGPGMGMPTDGAVRRLAAPLGVVVVAAALGALLLARGPLAPGSSPAGNAGPSSSAAASAVPASAGPTSAPTAAPTALPSARPTSTPAPAATPRPRTYKVKPGDSLTAIAAAFGTTVKELKVLNKITNPSLIRVGQVLKLP